MLLSVMKMFQEDIVICSTSETDFHFSSLEQACWQRIKKLFLLMIIISR